MSPARQPSYGASQAAELETLRFSESNQNHFLLFFCFPFINRKFFPQQSYGRFGGLRVERLEIKRTLGSWCTESCPLHGFTHQLAKAA